ncbi:SagB/ThcOx family dehydrogenase [Candidatus Bipolaricaulota sp. J31]
MKKVTLVAGAVLLAGAALGIGLYFALPRGASPTGAQEGGIIPLPEPRLVGEVSLEEAIARRRSIRSYADFPLTLAEVGQLLWAAQGITEPRRGFRAAPSAGATYPLELHLVVGEGTVEGLAAGVYRYLPEGHRLSRRLSGDLRARLAAAALGQPWVRAAPVCIVITAVYRRTTARYGERGVRYVHLEAGHVGQNIYLQAVALGLGTVAVGAFRDEEVAGLLELPADEEPLYIFPVGRPEG